MSKLFDNFLDYVDKMERKTNSIDRNRIVLRQTAVVLQSVYEQLKKLHYKKANSKILLKGRDFKNLLNKGLIDNETLWNILKLFNITKELNLNKLNMDNDIEEQNHMSDHSWLDDESIYNSVDINALFPDLLSGAYENHVFDMDELDNMLCALDNTQDTDGCENDPNAIQTSSEEDTLDLSAVNIEESENGINTEVTNSDKVAKVINLKNDVNIINAKDTVLSVKQVKVPQGVPKLLVLNADQVYQLYAEKNLSTEKLKAMISFFKPTVQNIMAAKKVMEGRNVKDQRNSDQPTQDTVEVIELSDDNEVVKETGTENNSNKIEKQKKVLMSRRNRDKVFRENGESQGSKGHFSNHIVIPTTQRPRRSTLRKAETILKCLPQTEIETIILDSDSEESISAPPYSPLSCNLSSEDLSDYTDNQQSPVHNREVDNDNSSGNETIDYQQSPLQSPVVNPDDDTSKIPPNSDKHFRSELEKKLVKQKSYVSSMEKSLLEEKKWEVSGEVEGSERPINSLLEADLEHDAGQRDAPVIEEEIQILFDHIISNRITQLTYDSVLQNVKPNDDSDEFKKTIILSQEKSTKSLAQVYEEEYLNNKEKTTGATSEQQDDADEVDRRTEALLKKLEILANFHFTPEVARQAAALVVNLPAAAVEEATAELTAEAASKLAPEEISETSAKPLVSKDELSKAEKVALHKKPRGRPRKYPKVLMSESDMERAAALRKRKRGRPKRFPMEDQSNNVKRGRGRPLKFPKLDMNNGSISRPNLDEVAVKSSQSFFERLDDLNKSKSPKKNLKYNGA